MGTPSYEIMAPDALIAVREVVQRLPTLPELNVVADSSQAMTELDWESIYRDAALEAVTLAPLLNSRDAARSRHIAILDPRKTVNYTPWLGMQRPHAQYALRQFGRALDVREVRAGLGFDLQAVHAGKLAVGFLANELAMTAMLWPSRKVPKRAGFPLATVVEPEFVSDAVAIHRAETSLPDIDWAIRQSRGNPDHLQGAVNLAKVRTRA